MDEEAEKLIDYQFKNEMESLNLEKNKYKKIIKMYLIIALLVIIIMILFFKIDNQNYSSIVNRPYLFISILGVFGILIVLCIIKIIKSKNEYNNIFKNKIFAKLLNNIDNSLTFVPSKGISCKIYDDSKLGIKYNQYLSTDLISGKIEDEFVFEMAEIDAKFIETNNENKTYITQVFNGLFSKVLLNKNINNNIFLKNNSIIKFSNKKEIHVDSGEFEKIFDLVADDRVQALQIFTSDIISVIMDFIEKYKIDFEMSIRNNILYMVFYTGKMFEAKVFLNDKELLLKYYKIVDFTIKINKKINEVIMQSEI